MSVATTSVTDFWSELVSGSLLGTDRRDPAPPPAGPLADLVADAVRPTPSGRMLAAVAACAVARRTGLQPQPPAAAMAPPAADRRPAVRPAAARRWRHVVAAWPVLEDEWLGTVDQRGWRLPPDLVVALLRRHRTNGPRREAVLRMAGPLGPWLMDHLPELAAAPGSRRPAGPSQHATRPDLPVSPELVPLLAAEPDGVVTAVAGGLAGGDLGPPHRAVLVNFVARCRPDTLHPLAEALRTLDGPGLAHLLADLAATRHGMITELAP